MLLQTKQFKDVCSIILAATDSSELSAITETLELKTVGSTLYLSVTNREYYVSVRFNLDQEEVFHATVNAALFLKLIAATTSTTIELIPADVCLIVKANGTYKIPLIFEDNTDQLLRLPEINIENKTVEMNIDGAILSSIVQYNSKELLKNGVSNPVQKMHYMDQDGCITVTTGACVNNFKLEKPVRMQLSGKLVKLFKLFKGESAAFALGHDPAEDGTVRTKISFITPVISLTSYIDDSSIDKVPVAPIRELATKHYLYSTVLNKNNLSQAIDRLYLFKNKTKTSDAIEINCTATELLITYEGNTETIKIENTMENWTSTDTSIKILLNMSPLKVLLDNCDEQYITFNFGDARSATVVRKNVIDVFSIKQVE